MNEANRLAGIQKLGRFIASATLPQAQMFLDAIDVSVADRVALVRAIDEFHRATVADTLRALGAFAASHSPVEVQALSDLGNRVSTSHAQVLATSAWSRVFKRLRESPPEFGLGGLEDAIAEYLRFAGQIGGRAIEADFAAGEATEGTHADLATSAQWQRLRQILRVIEDRLGERLPAFLTWARSIDPNNADQLKSLADLERSA
jgi:hypothetical protein